MVFFPHSLHITMSAVFSAWFLARSFPASSYIPVSIPYVIPTMYLQFFLFIWALSLQSILYLPWDNAILNSHLLSGCLSVSSAA